MYYRCEGEGIINYHVTIGVLYNDGVSFTGIMMWSGEIPVENVSCGECGS